MTKKETALLGVTKTVTETVTMLVMMTATVTLN